MAKALGLKEENERDILKFLSEAPVEKLYEAQTKINNVRLNLIKFLLFHDFLNIFIKKNKIN